MAPGHRSPGRRVRRALLLLIAGSLAGAVLLGYVDGSTGTSALSSAVRACAAQERMTEPAHPVDEVAVLAAVQDAAALAGGTVTVVVLDAGRRPLVTSPTAQHPQLTASLVKLLVVAEVLAAAPSPEDLALAERTSTSSDDAAMSALWVRHHGPVLIASAVARLGLSATGPPERPGRWGESLMSAQDVATTLARLGEVYGVGVAATLSGWLRSTTPTAADGFSQVFGLLSPAATGLSGVAAKQGWMCCIDDRRQLHSAGVLADGRIVVLLGDFPATVPWSAAVAALDDAAAAVVAGSAPPSGA